MRESTNPFATRCFQPGALDYEFFGKQQWSTFANLCRNQRGCSLIVGPHGSGKSTLLLTLAQELLTLDPDIRIESLFLHNDGNSTDQFLRSYSNWRKSDIVLLDGFEQLSIIRRMQVITSARWNSLPVIATSHRSFLGCPVLWRTSVDATTERWVISKLLEGRPSGVLSQALSSEDWRVSRERHQQNLRESLFDMYDWWSKHDSIS